MGFPWADVTIILALIVLNGFFSGAELAIVSSRKARLAAMARAQVRGAAAVLRLQAEPGRFLSSVQIGITLVGIANGAFSGARLSGPTAVLLERAGLSAAAAAQLGFGLVIAIVTYLSLVVGELVPKQLALRTPERFAVVVAPVMERLAVVSAPLVLLLDWSSEALVRLFPLKRGNDQAVTEEEFRHVMHEAEEAGVLEEEESELIAGIMRLADRPVRGIMTPRREIDWIDLRAAPAAVRDTLSAAAHTRLVVADGSFEKILGVVQARDVVAALLDGRPLSLAALVRPVPIVPDMADATAVLAAFRESDVPLALVIDEYGHFEGVVTPADVLAAIAGEFRFDLGEGHDPAMVERADGSWLISGSLPADELAEKFDFPLGDDRDFQTVAGFALAVLEHIPQTGEVFEAKGLRFEIVDMDGRKIDRLLVSRLAAE